ELLGSLDLLLDGTDNFETRYLLNDFAVSRGLPWIYCAAVGSYGATLNVIPGETACLRCIFTSPPAGTLETCDTAGILSSAAATIAAVAAAEAIKMLVAAKADVRRTLLSLDLWHNQRSEVQAAPPSPDCLACARRQFPFLAGEARAQ